MTRKHLDDYDLYNTFKRAPEKNDWVGITIAIVTGLIIAFILVTHLFGAEEIGGVIHKVVG